MHVHLAGIGIGDSCSEQCQQVTWFQCKIDEIFNDMPNVFGIGDDILVIGYNENGADHDAMVHKVLERCEEVNLKLNKKNAILGEPTSLSLER